MYEWIAPLIAGALLSTLILLAEHFLLWRVAGLLPSPMLALPAPDDELVINAEFTVE